MPSQRPSAAFDPIPPDLDLAALVEETPNFEYVTRVSCDMIEAQGMEAFEKLLLLHVVIGGKPLVIDGFQHRLDEWTFTSQWLKDNIGLKFENARNLTKQQNLPLSVGHYLNNLSKLTQQWNSTNYKEPDRQRIYLKDIDCPPIWHDKLEEHVPPAVFYLNDSTGDIGGPGAPDVVPTQKSAYTKGKGISRAGDLMSSLPPAMRADNLMCYIGHEGTYTPAHREMCASLGQNLMVETSGTVDEEGKPCKPGSSIWFMTETNDRHLVSEYWLSTLGHDIEVEKHFAQINAWKAAPFTTYIVEQKIGDFILIPPLAPHQVWNRGTRTMKVAWNRTTIETLELALHEALPRARMVCRDEQYKNKAMIYFTLQKYSDLLYRVESLKENEADETVITELTYSPKIRQLQKDFRRLFLLYTEILLSETLAPVSPNEKRGQYLPYDSFVTCSYCRCNIFNRFLTCETCVEPLANGEENTYDICMDCFAMGRSCTCISGFRWVEQFPWQELTERHEQWRHQIIDLDGGVNEKSPRSLQREKKSLGRKTLAQVCQEQLKIRPWNDPKDPKPALTTFELNHLKSTRKSIGEDGHPIPDKTSKKRADRLDPGFVIEHVSGYPREAWKCAKCSKCDRSYNYGSMWRMFDIMPQSVMEQLEWECPACQKTCSCGACRKKPNNIPYEPRGTVLGHDTKKVADARSVESLVDFSHSNLHHIKKVGDDDPLESRRLGRRIDEAAAAKAQDPSLDENYVDDEGERDEADAPIQEQFYENGIRYTTGPDIPIDPMLSIGQPALPTTRHVPNGNPHKIPRWRRGLESDGEWNGRPNSSKQKGHSKSNGPAKQSHQPSESTSIYGSGIGLRPPTGTSPLAHMGNGTENHTNPTTNRSDYQYPDPSMPNSTLKANSSQSLTSLSTRQDGSGSTIHLGHSNELSQDDSKTKQSGTIRLLQEAKRNNRFVIAEAALHKKTLPITLRIGRLGMALMADRLSSQSSLSGTSPTNTNKDLLQSDLTFSNQADKQPTVGKKRKVREEEMDDDFSVRKRRERKSHIAQVTRKEPKRPTAEVVTDDSSSESDLQSISFTTINKPQGPRRLPKYLADQHEDGDVQAELPSESSRRRTSQVSKPRTPISGGALTLAKARSTTVTTAQKAVEANRKAKQKAKQNAVQWADGNADPKSSSSDDDHLPSKTKPRPLLGSAKSTLMKVPESMFSRMAGKKIKISGVKPKGL